AGINGSGKHLNWSLGDSDGNNLFEPGAAPKKNIQFLAFTAALMAGVDKYGAVLRQAVADAGNDHRLGANEAPPAIMSVYLGEHLTALIDEIVKGGKDVGAVREAVDHGLKRLPQILRDSSDRNRTSPIAFTGNKFEFRAVGSSQNTSDPAAAWAVIMAYGIDQVIAKLEKAKGADITDKALAVVREIFKATARVRFEGNGYSSEWHKEAAKRGLPNTSDTPSAVEVLSDKAVAELYEGYKVLNKDELAAKKEIKLETYVKTKEIELKMLAEMAQTGIAPALARQIDELGRAREALTAVKADAKLLEARLREAGGVLAALYSGLDVVMATLGKSSDLDTHHRAAFLADKGVAALNALRDACDRAEGIVENSLWPYPKYREMLFLL
ncbi:MAG: glutamine synthetase type III, partial [Elusimicrobia bacterium]|nr:glutamine synthetase type III [Elusimicrobiota bacterium]